jgi:hypothetical protein
VPVVGSEAHRLNAVARAEESEWCMFERAGNDNQDGWLAIDRRTLSIRRSGPGLERLVCLRGQRGVSSSRADWP